MAGVEHGMMSFERTGAERERGGERRRREGERERERNNELASDLRSQIVTGTSIKVAAEQDIFSLSSQTAPLSQQCPNVREFSFGIALV